MVPSLPKVTDWDGATVDLTMLATRHGMIGCAYSQASREPASGEIAAR